MSLDDLADRTGLPAEQVDGLLEGLVGGGVAQKLGTGALIVQDFVEGNVKPAMGALLGISHQEAGELRKRLGREGAIGLIVGLLLGRTPP